jgi:hypothetical protein
MPCQLQLTKLEEQKPNRDGRSRIRELRLLKAALHHKEEAYELD